MIINNAEVKINTINNITTYDYFACTCKEEDEKFWFDKCKEMCSTDCSQFATPLLYELTSLEINNVIFNLVGIGSDMWMGFTIKASDGTNISIQCDMFEYGLAAALMIIEQVYS